MMLNFHLYNCNKSEIGLNEQWINSLPNYNTEMYTLIANYYEGTYG